MAYQSYVSPLAMEKLIGTFADLPPEVFFKTELLRQGVSFSPKALEVSSGAKPKSYFIFSFDRKTQDQLSQAEKYQAPEEIALHDGPWGFRRVIVSTRLNPDSPYRVDVESPESTQLVLRWMDTEICQVGLPRYPEYYAHKLSSGKPVQDMTPTIEWGYLIYLTAFRLCQYWGDKEECQFCDINENYRQQKREGRSYTAIKNISDVLESLAIINQYDPDHISGAYTVTGGSITTELDGANEGEFYARYARAIEERFPGRWIGKAVVQALPRAEVQALKDSGYSIYHPNYEVWDAALFDKLTPGKARYVGRDAWIKRILDSAEIFGPANVIPNFVAGIEMSRPHGFTDVEAAIASTREGLEFFMSRGIVPRFTVWCLEPRTGLAKTNNEPPPLEYYLRLLQTYRDVWSQSGCGVPPGYGEPGIGRAVFSVSAFMDVLPEVSIQKSKLRA